MPCVRPGGMASAAETATGVGAGAVTAAGVVACASAGGLLELAHPERVANRIANGTKFRWVPEIVDVFMTSSGKSGGTS